MSSEPRAIVFSFTNNTNLRLGGVMLTPFRGGAGGLAWCLFLMGEGMERFSGISVVAAHEKLLIHVTEKKIVSQNNFIFN